jgi:hypothetical protein
MDAISGPELTAEADPPPAAHDRRAAARGFQVDPFWTFVAGWSVFCGALASNQPHWHAETLLSLAIALLFVALAWSLLWNLATENDWTNLLRGSRSRPAAALPSLPYARPHALAGRIGKALGRVIGWWREVFWPAFGPVAVLCLLAVVLVAVLSLLLPRPVRWLNVALAGVVTLGLSQRHRERAPWVAQSLLYVGLSWLVGHLALAGFQWHAVAFALLFSLVAWGMLREEQGRAGWMWLLDGGQVIVSALLLALKQPLAAGGILLLVLGQILLHMTLRFGADRGRVTRWTWPWLLAAMLVAAWAAP